MFLKVRDNVTRLTKLTKLAGAARHTEIMKGVTGDTWMMLACLDRLVELGELREVTEGQTVAGQNRIYVRIAHDDG